MKCEGDQGDDPRQSARHHPAMLSACHFGVDCSGVGELGHEGKGRQGYFWLLAYISTSLIIDEVQPATSDHRCSGVWLMLMWR